MKPLIREVTGLHRPEEVYGLFASNPHSVFLDSAKDSYGMGRYSFIAEDPFLVFSSRGNRITLEDSNGTRTWEGNPFDELRALMDIYRMEPEENIPLPGGAIGYFGYDLGYVLEKIPGKAMDDINEPDCWLGFFDVVLMYDHHTEQQYIVSTGFPVLEEKERQLRAQERADRLEEKMRQAVKLDVPLQPVPEGPYVSNFSKEDYCGILQKTIDYIFAGDIFQANISQRFTAPFTHKPYDVYRYLRHINPAPFAAFLNCGEVTVASASPERYMQLKKGMVETRPIKGTRPRGSDPETDRRLGEELFQSAKDRSELVMIIDLERNDLGRVCKYGSVKVPELIRLEEYATVFHLVSTVVGELAEGKNMVDLVEASFPGGSITGAPKVRAMEIIDELETVRRGIYTGSIGYMGFQGDGDLNIVIRTMIIKDDKVHVQVGGGIVADSVPAEEYQETLDKARALMHALGYHQA